MVKKPTLNMLWGLFRPQTSVGPPYDKTVTYVRSYVWYIPTLIKLEIPVWVWKPSMLWRIIKNNSKCNQPITKIWTIFVLWVPKKPHNLLGRLKNLKDKVHWASNLSAAKLTMEIGFSGWVVPITLPDIRIEVVELSLNSDTSKP